MHVTLKSGFSHINEICFQLGKILSLSRDITSDKDVGFGNEPSVPKKALIWGWPIEKGLGKVQ